MTDEITLYTNPFSRGRIAHWMLEEVGVPYRVELLRFDKGEHKSPQFLKINPMGKVPTIVDRGTVVTEAAAICTYLADVFPAAGLAPAVSDAAARGTYLRWLFFGAGCIEPALVDKIFERPMPDRPGALGYGNYKDTLDALESAVTQGDFILGDRFSAADVYVGSQIGWGLMGKSIEPRPAFLAYWERCQQRPSFRRFSKAVDELAQALK